MGKKGFSKRRVIRDIKEHFRIIEDYQARIHPSHYFFWLQKNK